MKKLLVLFLLLIPSVSFAAMTCVESGSLKTTPNVYVMNLVCTFDATPGTAVATLTSSIMGYLNDRIILSFRVIEGSTGPTDNSDLAIVDSRGSNILSATGNGADVIDNAAATGPFYGDGPTPGSTNALPIAHAAYPWTITVTNNAVNNSSFILSMDTVKMY